MIGALPVKLAAPPVSAGLLFLASIFDEVGGEIGVVLNIAALGILVGGFVVVGYYRSSLDAKNEIIKDLKDALSLCDSKADKLGTEVRDLRVEMAKIESELEASQRRIVQLEERPDMGTLLAEINSGREQATQAVNARLDALIARIDAVVNNRESSER